MKKRLDLGIILAYALLTLGLVVTVTPMLYMVTTSLRPNGALFEYPPRLFPRLSALTLENFAFVLIEKNFSRQFLNSVFVTACSVALAAFASSSLGFCLARFRFRGRRIALVFMMATLLMPGMTLIIPQFELAVALRLINKLGGLIPVYAAWVLPFSTFMLKGFIDYIPRDFDEAMYMDGGNALMVYAKIVVPLSSPAIASVSVFNFLTAWEEYPWAMTVINDNELRTLPIAIAGFFGQHNLTDWGYVFAMSVISLVPVVVVFLVLQRYFVSGLYAGGIKG